MADLSTEKKLIWLGLRNAQRDSSELLTEIDKLREEVGDFSTYQSDLDSVSSYSEHSTYLQNNNFTQTQAETFNQKAQNNFNSWSDYKDFVQNQASSYADLAAEFGSSVGLRSDQRTSDGNPAAGVRIHEEAGVSLDGVDLPASTVEVFGNRIEFSGTGEPTSTSPTITYSNLQVSDTTPERTQVITVSATVENTGSAAGRAYPQLKIGGRVTDSKGPLQLSPSESTSVQFSHSFDELEGTLVTIADLSPVPVSVVPETFL